MAPPGVGRSVRIEIEDVQGLILRGFGSLKASCYLALQIRDLEGARAWLREIARELTPAAEPVTDRHVNVAFSYLALEKLGLSPSTLAGFANAFLEGVDGGKAVHRSAALGDVGESAPENWRWGNAQRPVEIALLLFARDEAGIEAFTAFHRERLDKHGLAIIGEFGSLELPGRKEHFGFRDGISQPAIRNANPPDERLGVLEQDRAENTVEPGEFLFGYTNQYGELPHGPCVDAELDRAGILAPHPAWSGMVHDFGRNGSYLVWRQLEEHAHEFWRTIHANAADDPAARTKLAAKFFGRWPSGAPLALAPDFDDPKLQDANEFSYAKDDPYGFRTPLGSHIRRGNPRDWNLSPKPETSVKIANAHRIIRRGRPYGPPVAPSMDPEHILVAKPDGEERGVHFVCFMADIERQYEMVQHTWVNNPKYGGLSDEVDPMLGAPPETGGTFTVQATPLRRSLTGISRFVTVRGAAYLFMPSLRAVRYLASLGR